MDLSQLHFAYPAWFYSLLFIPVIWAVFFLYYQKKQPQHQLEKFIDKHLIPFLLIDHTHEIKKVWSHLFIWTIVWSCLVLALAGPRWNYREINTYTRDQSLAVLLDLSESMNAKDIHPSRLVRAKQKIEDLLNLSRGVKIGLVAFAADPHMIVPMTEDKETIRHLLPSLDTDLVYVQGSRLAPALEMSAKMLENEPGSNKAIVVITDGGFEDASAIQTVKKIAEKGIAIYTLGVGTLEGAPLNDRHGAAIKKNGATLLSKLEKEKLREISKQGRGRYFDADHSEQVALIFDDLAKRSDIQEETHKTQRFWEEHFYLFLIPVIPFFFWWFRKGFIFASLLVFVAPIPSEASLRDYFYNPEQQAGQAYAAENYPAAAEGFQDPYKKGVAYYRQGDYKAAEEMFRQSTRPEVASGAAYNLGNTLVQQNKLQDAIKAYEDVLKKWPEHTRAKENLELVKKMLEQQEQQKQEDNQNSKDNSEQQKNQQDKQQNEENKQKDESSNTHDNENQKQEQTKQDSDPDQKENRDSDKQESNKSKESPQQDSEEDHSPGAEKEKEKQSERQSPPQKEKEKPMRRSQEDLDADLWLDQIKNDQKTFLKNKFYLESKKNGTKEEVDPW